MAMPRVVIIGGGFAGVNAAKQLTGKAKITLIDEKDDFVFKPLLDEYIVGTVSDLCVRFPYRDILPSVTHIRGRAEDIDYKQRTVRVARTRVRYDYLIIAIGARARDFHVHDELAAHIYDIQGAEDTRKRMRTLRDRALEGHTIRVAIIGGGAVGVESAGLLKDFLNTSSNTHEVVLYTAADRLLENEKPRAGERATNILAARGITIHYETFVTGITKKRKYRLESRQGTQQRAEYFDEIIWCAGIEPKNLGPCELEADRYLRLKGYRRVFVAGDCACHAQPVPALAQTAIAQGRLVAHNILRAIRGHPLRAYVPYTKGVLVTVGHLQEIYVNRGVVFSGALAWVVHRIVYIAGMLGIERKRANILRWAGQLFRERHIYLNHPPSTTRIKARAKMRS